MRLYRALLTLYPASFRHEYGAQMEHDFELRRRDASGLVSRPGVWLEAVGDLLVNATRVHLEMLRSDVRYALRAFRRAPGFALTAIVVTALGIGANTAVFPLADRVLIRPLPYPDADRLVKLWEDVPGYSRMEPSPPNYRDWKARATSFEAMGALAQFSVNVTGVDEPRRVANAGVTSDILAMLGVQPIMGRTFTAEDDRIGAPGVAILSYALWQRDFGGDSAIVGRTLRIEDDPHVIVGVMPAAFAFPSRETEMWTSMRQSGAANEDRDNNYLQVLARLKPGVTADRAAAEMRAIAADLEREYPKENARSSVRIVALRDEVSDQAWLMLVALAAAAGCVLLIACTNLASLLLARALDRRRELSVRTALGAGRERLVRQLLTESVLLATAGGLAGIFCAMLGAPLLARLVPPALAVGDVTAIDGRVLMFAAVLTLATGLGFGVVPALRLCRDTDLSALREGPRAGAHLATTRLRSTLVVAQVLAAVVLLVVSGLLIRALLRVQNVDPGFRVENVLAVDTPVSTSSYASTARRENLYGRILGDVKALPGVLNAAYISYLPMVMRGGIWPVIVDGRPRGEEHRASLRFITPGFFDVMGIHIRSGRAIGDEDTASGQAVAVVSESFARQHWPGQDAIGRQFTMAFQERTVVGVCTDIRVRGLERTSEPQVYLPHKQMREGWLLGYIPKELVVHTAGRPTALVPAIRDIIRRADADLPIARVRTLEEVVRADTAPRTVQVRVLGTFAALALVLAGVGIHGLLAFSVGQRTREIGVRMALGATRGHILRLVGMHGLTLTALGAVGGLALGYLAARAIQSILFGIHPADPATFAAAAAVVAVMTLSGTLIPALRASRVDPTSAMRAE